MMKPIISILLILSIHVARFQAASIEHPTTEEIVTAFNEETTPFTTLEPNVEPTTAESWKSNFQNTKCNFTECKQPNCMCLNDVPPNGLHPKEIPQFVLITFDGAITVTNYPYYKDLFQFNNPNGCPIHSTYFVSHVDTNYNLVHELYRHGNEIGAHSISKAVNNYQDYWRVLNRDGWKKEFGGQKKIIAKYADIPEEAIKGARAPNLQTAGNDTFAALVETGYSYDCSNPSRKGINTPFFPYTLDYGFQRPNDCPMPPCLPEGQIYPGFWEIPMNDWNVEYVVNNVTNNRECATASGCVIFKEDGTPDYNPSDETIFKLFMSNFHRFYDRNRAPFPVFLSEEWMGIENHRKGLVRFIKEISAKKDVYFISLEELIEWMRSSKSLEEYSKETCKEIKQTPCTIEHEEDIPKNQFKKHCDYHDVKVLGVIEKRLIICQDQECPAQYPWIE